ncbi:tail fiber assembly protein [Morganella morganii]
MKIYHYYQNTGEFIAAGMADPDPLTEGNWLIPAHATEIEPLKAKPRYAVCFINGQWEYIRDYRGSTAYSKADRQSVPVDFVGELPDTLTLSKPETDFDEWNGKKWVTNTQAQKNSELEAAETQKQFFIAEAMEKTQLWQTQLMLGIITDEDKASLREWMLYVQKVQVTDISPAPDIDWPQKPQ